MSVRHIRYTNLSLRRRPYGYGPLYWAGAAGYVSARIENEADSARHQWYLSHGPISRVLRLTYDLTVYTVLMAIFVLLCICVPLVGPVLLIAVLLKYIQLVFTTLRYASGH